MSGAAAINRPSRKTERPRTTSLLQFVTTCVKGWSDRWHLQGMRRLCFLALVMGWGTCIDAQPTSEAFFRTVRIQSKFGTGTTFAIEVDDREYWITAAHILTGSKGKPFGRV